MKPVRIYEGEQSASFRKDKESGRLVLDSLADRFKKVILSRN